MRAGPVLEELLRSREPSIRWKARVGVLGEDRDSDRIQRLEEAVAQSPRVRALLSRRAELGRESGGRVYAKWQGVHWVLAHLSDLGYPRGDERLYPLRDRMNEYWLRPVFYDEFEATTESQAYRGDGVPRIRGRYRRCASQQGNALYSSLRLGIADERADALVERLLRWQWPDGGWNCDRKPKADTSSFMETRHSLLGLAAYARERKSAAASAAVDRASEVFLRRRLFKRASDGTVIHPEFTKLHYPLYYHYDILGGLKAMAEIGRIADRRCADALDLLESKRLPTGQWSAERRYYKVRPKTMESSADYVDWGGTRRGNEWVTVDALSVLRAAGRLDM